MDKSKNSVNPNVSSISSLLAASTHERKTDAVRPLVELIFGKKR
jgi:hypothetical protein